MVWYTADVEVFNHDWIVIFKLNAPQSNGEYIVFHNDNQGVRDFISDEDIYCFFNGKRYDNHIIKAICMGLIPEEIKEVNDWIIAGNNGWECPLLRDYYFKFNSVDIRDDMQENLSLKAIEGHLYLPIKESSVPFDIDRPLTDEELAETIEYCKHDIDTTEQLVLIRKNYLKTKMDVGRLAGLSDVKSLSMTNAKLTAALLKASKTKHDDGRDYVYPDNLKRTYIPPEVFDFFDRLHDPEISDEEIFDSKIEIRIGECPITIGFGGIHGAIPHYTWSEPDSETVLRNYDVGSYYPHLMTLYGYSSRNIPSPDVYDDVLTRRMIAKQEGDSVTANTLKLVCNTTYGATLDKYNDLYDPLMGRSVCISGQLFLLELANHLYQKIEGLRIVQINTDGVMVEFDAGFEDDVYKILDEWEERTRFNLEEDLLEQIVQKDVNNYIEVQKGGKTKLKGGYLVRGTSSAGAWKVNNNACIVATAIAKYFTDGNAPEDTINECNDIFQYQMIAKASSKYKEVYQLVNGEKVAVQKVNRVYATKDESYGTLYKVKTEDNSIAKIESLPEHCIIDNNNELHIKYIDKNFYINLAKKRINDFLGIETEKKKGRKKKMANTKKSDPPSMNVYQKLALARDMFLQEGIAKTGKNMNLSFKYFELKDIVPLAIAIFKEVGLLQVTNFANEIATLTIVNTEKPEETIVFSAPFVKLDPIISKTGKQATNEMMALGASITYMRRYLYMVALDVCESDQIDAGSTEDDTSEAPVPNPVVQKPATSDERKEVKEQLTQPSGTATELQIKGLKSVIKKLMAKDPSMEEMITGIEIETEGFTTLSKQDCEDLIEQITDMLEVRDDA